MNRAINLQNYEFQIVQLRARPLIAIPIGSKRIQSAAIRCFATHSLKRVLIKSALSTAVFLRCSKWLWARSINPIINIRQDIFKELMNNIREKMKQSYLQPVIVWPAQADRGRIYIHYLNEAGDALYFAKVAMDERNCKLIKNEGRALRQIHEMELKNCYVPSILASGTLQSFVFLVLEYISFDNRIIDWHSEQSLEGNIKEYSGKTKRLLFIEVEQLNWWKNFNEENKFIPEFAAMAYEAAADGIEVCRVHGDLNKTNILRKRNHVWLLDWEHYSEKGPCMTDTICLELDRLWPIIKRNPAAGFRRLLEAHWNERDQEHRKRTIMALAFLVGAGFPPARIVANLWVKSFKSNYLHIL